MSTIKSFVDLNAWKKSHTLRIEIIQHTATFPQVYQYGLGTQLQRSSISVASNIAEGFGRNSSKEKLNFYNIARGSLTEVQDQLILCAELKLISKKYFLSLSNQSIEVHKLINGLSRHIRDTSNKKRDTN